MRPVLRDDRPTPPMHPDELRVYDDGQWDGDPDATRIEIAATGHVITVGPDPEQPGYWAVSISAGEGPGMTLVRMSARQPADLLMADLRNAIQYVVEHPARPLWLEGEEPA